MSDNEETIPGLIAKIVERMDPGAMMTGYVFAIEGMDNLGQRAIYFGVNEEAKAWETLGRLEYVKEQEVKKIHDRDL